MSDNTNTDPTPADDLAPDTQDAHDAPDTPAATSETPEAAVTDDAPAPAEAPAETPDETPTETPAETSAEVSAGAPAEVPAELPGEVPAVEAAAPSESIAPVTSTAPAPVTKPAAGGWFWGTGRRKAAVARVRVKAGSGAFKVNNRDLTEFFSQERDHNDINHVLKSTGTDGAVDVAVSIRGGGYTGQAGAIILGLGRALRNYDPTLDATLREHGFLTRDPRRVERKKPGQPGARKRFQFSKR